MENRLELNKRPVYELPDNVLVDRYDRYLDKKGILPKFEPDVCITAFGSIKESEAKKTVEQIWVKTDNRELINFIKDFDFESRLNKITNAYRLNKWLFKKIILEEFYGEKYGE